jgi:predicted regulator of Ras-like GTPase activity (Roadblock/LC7/MglB family)
MDLLLQEITMLPGVLGCFVFNGKQRVLLGSKMPPIFKEKNLQAIGSLLTRTVQIGSMAMLLLKEIEIRYNESLLIIKPLPKEALLVIICEPNANKSLINMTTGMLAKDIAKVITQSVAAPPLSPQATQRPLQQKASPQKEAVIDDNLAAILEQVKGALAMAIGPIAGPVMKDNIEIWAKQKAPSFSNLSTLTDLLCKEINNDTLEKEFTAAVKTIKNR